MHSRSVFAAETSIDNGIKLKTAAVRAAHLPALWPFLTDYDRRVAVERFQNAVKDRRQYIANAPVERVRLIGQFDSLQALNLL